MMHHNFGIDSLLYHAEHVTMNRRRRRRLSLRVYYVIFNLVGTP